MIKKIIIFTASAVLFSLLLFTRPTFAGVVGFKPGRIIDDVVFTNISTMTVSDIQSFLSSKVPVCDTYGTQMYTSSQTRAQFAATIGQYPPFTCIKDFSENGLTAAQIIYNAAHTYNINPQVLIVLLQKEQGLITDTWPYVTQYRSATGYGCPDTAACNTAYYGFTNQVAKAANMFRKIMNASPDWYTPYVVGNNYILYNPNTACGGSTVNIENRATQALYSYTPYQPNQAALNAGWGTVPCGAYGNRNFYLYFTTWFGPTSGTAFFQFPGGNGTYVYGANNTYYFVTSYDRLLDYGFGSKFNYRVDQLTNEATSNMTYAGELPPISRFEGDGIFVISDSTTHAFPSSDIFNAFGYSFGNEAKLPSWLQYALNSGTPVAQVVHSVNTPIAYYIDQGKRHTFCNSEAFNLLGSPVYSSLPSTSLSDTYLTSIPLGAPIARDGDLIASADTPNYGLWQNGAYYPMEAAIAGQLGVENCRVPQVAVNQLPQATAIGNAVITPSGKHYLLDKQKKLSVDASSMQAIGVTDSNFTTVPDSFADRITTTEPLSTLVRVNNADGVYVLEGGKSYGIPSPEDLYGLGYTFNQVQNISERTFAIATSSSPKYKPGRVVRIGSQDGVYLLDSNFRQYAFTSASSFLSYGYKWSEVISVNQPAIGAYVNSGVVSPYAKDETGAFWLVSKGKRYKISDALQQPAFYAVSDANSRLISSQSLSRLTESTLTKVFRADSSDGVYLVENGQKRVFTSAPAFFGKGFQWGDVMSLDSEYVKSLPTGAPIY